MTLNRDLWPHRPTYSLHRPQDNGLHAPAKIGELVHEVNNRFARFVL